MRIIVIGSGIGGLTTAIALRKPGIDVQLYEQTPRLTEVGAGIAIAANALRALDVLALASDLRSQSVAGVRGELRRPNGSVLAATVRRVASLR